MTVQIRHAKAADIGDMHEIEQASFSDPWDIDEFELALKSPKVKVRVALMGGEIVGYIITQDTDERLKVVNLAVAPEFRRSGIAKQLVEVAVRKSWNKNVSASVVDVNLPGHLFFKSLGFTCTKIEKGEYETVDGGYQDAYRFERTTS